MHHNDKDERLFQQNVSLYWSTGSLAPHSTEKPIQSVKGHVTSGRVLCAKNIHFVAFARKRPDVWL